MRIKRRDFVKLFGGVTGAIALGAFGFDQEIEVPDEVLEQVRKGNGIETWKNTICRQCPGGCGIRVRLIDDVPVFIKGNPLYPVNQGGMCPLGRSALEVLYNPDRLKTPIRRVGVPGSGRWAPITWDEALETVSSRLIDLRSSGRSHEVTFLGSDERGMMAEHISRFMSAYGSPNYYRSSTSQNNGVPFRLQQGNSAIPSADLLGARLVMSFGANFLEEGNSPVYYTKLYSRSRDPGNGVRTRFVHIDSRMNLTAANADSWIPIRPGTYGALALGIAHVLIREEFVDTDFIRDHTFGYDDFSDRGGQSHIGFKTLVLDEYYPERVSEITGVPSATILEIARELGLTRPSVVLGDQGAVDNTNGTYSQMAIHSLNALLGNFEKDGGIIHLDDPPLAAIPDVDRDAAARDGNTRGRVADSVDGTYPFSEFSLDAFTENVLADRPYPTSVLFLYKGNPLFQALNHHRLVDALRRIPLVVSFDSFVNETNEYADIILPEPTFLETWDEVSNVSGVAFTHVGIQQPIVAPFFESRPAGDVLIDLANRVGGTVATASSDESYGDLIMHRARGLYESGAGAVVSESVRGQWLEFLQQRGWHVGRYDSFSEFWRLLTENGGWWNPIRNEIRPQDVFDTPSNRFEFFSQILYRHIQEQIPTGQDSRELLERLNITARRGSEFLPHHEPVVAIEGDFFRLYLTTFQVLTNRDGQGANQPLMQEMFGYTVRKYWDSWVELNPETAAEYNVSEGDRIWVQSAVGSVRVEARIHPGILPNVVSIPFGLGHTSYGRYAAGHGVNPNQLIRARFDMLSGKPALQATRVNITRAV